MPFVIANTGVPSMLSCLNFATFMVAKVLNSKSENQTKPFAKGKVFSNFRGKQQCEGWGWIGLGVLQSIMIDRVGHVFESWSWWNNWAKYLCLSSLRLLFISWF